MEWLLEPWREPAVRSALAEVVLLGLSAGALGCWVVLLGQSYGAESLAHAMLPGLVIAAVAGIPLMLGGAAGLLVAAAGIGLAARGRETGPDVATAVVVTGLLGLGALLALSPASPPGIAGLLFGDVLAARAGDLALAGTLAVVVLLALALLHARLSVLAFDRTAAAALGVRPRPAELALLGLLALSVLVAVQGLGNLLVVAVLVAPAATARRLTDRLGPMMAVAAALAVLGGVAGLYVSYYAGVAAGAAIAGALVALYALGQLIPAAAARRPSAGSPSRA